MAVVIANMIGTGVFTSLGFQLLDLQSGFVLLMLWVVGGIAALCGALTYAELGAALPRSGGEYNFLSQIYHPMAGFISGWVSATIGFAAPTALAAISFGTYFSSVFPLLSSTWLAVGLVLVLSFVHTTNRRNSGQLQLLFTLLKLLIILIFSVLALSLVENPQEIEFTPVKGDGSLLIGSTFAISLIYVNYAYTGWNAATYLSGEMNNPQKNLPVVLVGGTLVVLVTYVLLNFVFLYVAPVDAMKGKLEIGYVAASYVFEDASAMIMGILLSLLLISTVSAMIIAGPRVLQVIGEDFRAFRLLGVVNAHGIPATAILTQMVLTICFILTSSFEFILVSSGFILGLNSLMTVAGIYVLRWRQPQLDRPYRTFLYPLTPFIYLALTCWTLVYICLERSEEALTGFLVILAGVLFYFASGKFGTRTRMETR